MSALKIGIYLLPISAMYAAPDRSAGDGAIIVQPEVRVDAELLDIGDHFCRLRIPRHSQHFDSSEVGVRFAWTDLIASVIWTNTTDEFVEMGLLLPSDDDRP